MRLVSLATKIIILFARARHRCVVAILCLATMLSNVQLLRGYSVLSHEAIIDAAWETDIQPLLLSRYPGLTPEQLREAHAHAYGGCIIQDLGYYPFGSRFFSDLVHYVRSGDFVEALLQESQDANELAFALGALAHGVADAHGHELATNRAVPIMYPKLRREFGDIVTFEKNRKAHVLVEFSFDVVQVAGSSYSMDAYRDFIGFKVAARVLERAFKQTYGLELRDILADADLAIRTYRYLAGKMIPQLTVRAWETKRDEIEKVSPGITRQRFIYDLSRRDFEKEYGTRYDRPGLLVRIVVFLFSMIPKFGPFQTLSFKPPTPEVQEMFLESIRITQEQYRRRIAQVRAGQLELPNENLDTGERTHAANNYRAAEETYAELVDRLKRDNFAGATSALRHDILTFYYDYKPPYAKRKEQQRWLKTVAALYELRETILEPTQTVAK